MLFVWTPPQTMTHTGFDVFWAHYPRHEARKKAEQAWCKLKPSPELQQTMLAAIEAQKRWRLAPGWHPDWPHGSTWLNGERWTDEVPQSARVVTWTRDEETCPNCGHPGGQCAVYRECQQRQLAQERAKQASA